jgi:RimJ/RimL family protein N-acetyltransferase
MADYTIAIPELEDMEGIIEMHVQSWLDVYPNEEHGISREHVQESVKRFTNEDGHKKRQRYIEEAHTNPDYFFRIAKDMDGKIVGFIDVRRGDTENELGGLYLDKTAYGSGLAQQLADQALNWLGEDGKDIRLTVATYNDRAQTFYRKLGFELVPGSECEKDKTGIPIVEMLRKRREV